jgi:PAS domain S-box-containing protein
MMTFAQYQEHLRYVRFGPDDAQALARLLPYVEPHTGAVAEEFYERIREHPDADRVFKDEAQVRRLQQTLQVWVLELLRGPYDEAYFTQRCRIGAVHARVGIAQRYVVSAMTLVRLNLQRISARAFAGEPAMDTRVGVALGKVIDAELTIMMETYRAALVERVERVGALERAGIAQRLAAAEERYRDAIESVQAVLVVLDEEQRVLLWNALASSLTGYARDEALGRPMLDEILPDEEARRRILAVTPGSPVTFEATLRTRSGRERYLRWFVSATVDPEQAKPRLYALGVDLTDVQEAEQRARDAERLAAVGTMAAGLAHEIRNPLNAVSLHISLLERALRRLPDPPEAATEATKVLRDETKRLSALVSEFLDFARPRPLTRSPLNLIDLMARVVELLAPDAARQSVTLRLERPARPMSAIADGEKLTQVFINLVRNAIEAMSGGGVVTLRARRVGTSIEVDVEDDGPGIPDGSPVFDAFYTTREHGTGLGLAIVHRIVNDHGGAIRLRSQPGETVFTIRLAAAPSEEP